MNENEPRLNLKRALSRPTDTNNQSSAADETIVVYVARAAHEVSEQAGKTLVIPALAGRLDAETLLKIVAYCYAKGVVSSAEIERRLCADSELHAVLGAELPERNVIRRFRQLNRVSILAALEAALAEYWRAHPERQAAKPESLEATKLSDRAHERALKILEHAIVQDRADVDE